MTMLRRLSQWGTALDMWALASVIWDCHSLSRPSATEDGTRAPEGSEAFGLAVP